MDGLTRLQGRPVKDVRTDVGTVLYNRALSVKNVQDAEQRTAPALSGEGNEARMDRAEFTQDLEQPDIGESALQFIESLRQYYHGIDFYFYETKDDEETELSKIAAGLGRGKHVVISKDFLTRMQSSQEEFEKCSKVLAEELKKLSKLSGNAAGAGVFLGKEQVYTWTAASREPEFPDTGFVRPNQNNSSADSKKLKMTSSSSFNVSNHYGKIASARTEAEVKHVMGDIQYSIMSLKMTAIYGDDEQRVKASRAVRSLQKLLVRGRRKIRRINRERLKQYETRRAEKQQEEQKERRLKLELKRMRSSRKGDDYSLIKEGLSEEGHIRSYRRYKGLYGTQSQRVLAAGDMVVLQAGPGETAGASDASGASGGGFAPGDISISQGVSF